MLASSPFHMAFTSPKVLKEGLSTLALFRELPTTTCLFRPAHCILSKKCVRFALALPRIPVRCQSLMAYQKRTEHEGLTRSKSQPVHQSRGLCHFTESFGLAGTS